MNTDDHLAKLDELLDREAGLSEWEVEFLESLNKQRDAKWTPRQINKLEDIFEKVAND